MVTLSIISLFIHAYIIAKGVTFFRVGGAVREADKSVVATVMGFSVMFIISLMVAWNDVPWRLLTSSIAGLLFMSYITSTAFLNLAIITVLTTTRKERHKCSTSTRRG